MDQNTMKGYGHKLPCVAAGSSRRDMLYGTNGAMCPLPKGFRWHKGWELQQATTLVAIDCAVCIYFMYRLLDAYLGVSLVVGSRQGGVFTQGLDAPVDSQPFRSTSGTADSPTCRSTRSTQSTRSLSGRRDRHSRLTAFYNTIGSIKYICWNVHCWK